MNFASYVLQATFFIAIGCGAVYGRPQEVLMPAVLQAVQTVAAAPAAPAAAVPILVPTGEEGEMTIVYAPPAPPVLATQQIQPVVNVQPLAALNGIVPIMSVPLPPLPPPPRPQLIAQASQMARLFHDGQITQTGLQNCPTFTYNSTYPLSPIQTAALERNGRVVQASVLPFGVISDPDELTRDPRQPGTYTSFFLNGQLTIYKDVEPIQRPNSLPYRVELIVYNGPGQKRTITTHLNYGNRGGEYSELYTFNGSLYASDDKTGTVFTVKNANDMNRPIQLIPRYIVANGDGQTLTAADGYFKHEWATTKDGFLYMGSFGNYEYMDVKNDPVVGVTEIDPFTGHGQLSKTMQVDQWLVDNSKRWVKRLSPCGWLEHLDWNAAYRILDKAMNVSYAQRGYLKHEAVQWSEHLQRWVAIPRFASPLKAYDAREEGYTANHHILFANELFTRVEVVDMKPPFLDTRAVVSFKFIPGTNDRLILALKAVELEAPQQQQASYLNVIDILSGESLMEDFLIDNKYKFEGVEFL